MKGGGIEVNISVVSQATMASMIFWPIPDQQ
jgi:hypothetical protein